MANGKPNDNPISDMLIHGYHPFPEDMESMIREILKKDPHAMDHLVWEPFDWEEKKNLEEGRKLLRDLLASLSSK